MIDYIIANEEIFMALFGIAFLGMLIWLSWASRRTDAKKKTDASTEKSGVSEKK